MVLTPTAMKVEMVHLKLKQNWPTARLKVNMDMSTRLERFVLWNTALIDTASSHPEKESRLLHQLW